METEADIPELTSSLEIKGKEKEILAERVAEQFDGILQESSSKDLNEPLKTAEYPVNSGAGTAQEAMDTGNKAINTLTANVGAIEDETVLESPPATEVASEGTCGVSEQCQDKDEKMKAVEEESEENHVTEKTREIAEKVDSICNIVDDTRTSIEMESVKEANVKVKGVETLMEESIFKQIEANETQQVSAEENTKLTEEGKNGLEKNGRQETNEEKRTGLNSGEKVIRSLEAASGQKQEALFYADVEANNLSTVYQTTEASQKKESIASTIEEVEEKKSECCSLSMGEESSPNKHKEDKVTVTDKENTENAPNHRENLEEIILPQHEPDKTKLEKCDSTCDIIDDTRKSVEMEGIEKANLKAKEKESLMEETIIKQIDETRQSSAEENPKLAAKEKKVFEQNAREEKNKDKITEFDSNERIFSITEAASVQKDEALFYAPDKAVNNLSTGVETTEAWQKKKSTSSIIDTRFIQDNFGEKGFEEVEDKKSDCCSTWMDKERSPNEYKEEHGHVESEHTLVKHKGSITDKMTLIAGENKKKAPNQTVNFEEILLQHEPEKMKLDSHSKMVSMDIDTTFSKEYFERVACIEESFEGRAVADKSTNSGAIGNLGIPEEKKILHSEFDKIENVEIEPQEKNANDVLLSHLIIKETIQPEAEKQEKVLVVHEEQTHEATEASRDEEKQIEDSCRAPSTETTILEHASAGALMTEDIQPAAEGSDANKGVEKMVLGAEDLERTSGLNPTEKIDSNTVNKNMEGEINKEDAEEMHKEYKRNMADDDGEKQILEGKDQLAELTAVEVIQAVISAPISNEEMNQSACSHQAHHIAHNTSGSEQLRKQDMDEGRAIDNFHLPAKQTEKLAPVEEEKEKKQKEKEVQDLDSGNKEKAQVEESEDNMRTETLKDREKLNNDDHPMNTSKASKEETVPKEIDGSLVDISWERQMSVEERKEDFLMKENPSICESGSISVFKVLEEGSLNETEPRDVKQQESDGLACQEKAKDAKRARLDSLDIIVRTDGAYNMEDNRNEDQEEVDEDEEKIEQEIYREAPTVGSDGQNVVATSEQSKAQDNLRKVEKEVVRDEMAVKMNETEDSESGTAFARKVRANNQMQMHQGDDQYEKHSSSSEDEEILERENPTNQTDICISKTSRNEKPLNEESGVEKLEDKKNFKEGGDNKNAIQQQVDSGVVYEGPTAENALVEQEAGTDGPRTEAANTEEYGTLPEENFKSAESSEECKCTSGIVTKSQSEDTIPLTSESQEEIKRNDIHNQSFTSTEQQNSGETLQEDQNNKEEKTVINVLPEDHCHSIQNSYDVNKAVNINKELEGVKKDNDDENIRHQKEEGSHVKELLPVSSAEERTNNVKDYSPVFSEYFIAEHSNEETEKANFEPEGVSTGKTKAATTEEMDEGKVEDKEDREKPVGFPSIIAEDSEEKNKKESTNEADKIYDKINTTVATLMAQTSLEKSQLHKKPEVSNTCLEKRISCTVETEPSQQGNLTDSTSPEETISSSVSQAPIADHEDIGNTATKTNPDAGEIDQTELSYSVYEPNGVEERHETMKSLPLEMFHLDEARKAIKETSETVYVFHNSQDTKAVVGNAIVAELNLTAEDLDQQLQTLSPTSPLKEQKHEIIATIKNEQGVQTTEYESSEKPLATKTAEETCLNKKDLHCSNFSQSGFELNNETEIDCWNKLNETGRTLNEIREENKNDCEKEVKSEIQDHEAATDDEHRADQTHNVENLKEQHQAPPPALLFEGQKHGLTATIENSKEVETIQDEEEMSADKIYEGNEMVSTFDFQDIKAANTMDSPIREKSGHQAALSAMPSQDEGTLYEVSAKTKEASATVSESESQKLREHGEAEIASGQTFTKEKLEEPEQMPHFALPSKEKVHGILTPIKSINDNVNAVELLADESQQNFSAPCSAEKICLQEEETRELEVASLGHDITTEVSDDSSEVHRIKRDIAEEASKLEPREYENEIDCIECLSESKKTTGLEGPSEKVSTLMSETSAKSLEHVSEVYNHEVSTKKDAEMKEKLTKTQNTDLWAEKNQCKKTVEATNEKEKKDANNCHPISLTEEKSEGSHQNCKQKAQEHEKQEKSMRNTGCNKLSEKIEKVDPTKKIEGEDGAEEKTVEHPDQVDIDNDNETIKESISSMEQVHRTTSTVVNMVVEAIFEDKRPENYSATKTPEETSSRKERHKESEISCLGLAPNKDNWEGSPYEVNKEVRTLDGSEEESKEDYEMVSTMDSQDIRAEKAIQSLPVKKSEKQHQQTYPEMLSEEQEHGSSTTIGRQENTIKEMKLLTREGPENSASKTAEEASLLEEETSEPKVPQMRHELDMIDKESTNEVLKEGVVALEESSEDIEEASARVSASKTQRLRGDEVEETATDQTILVQELKEKTPSPLHSKEQEHGTIKKNDVEGLQDKSQENSLALWTTKTTCLLQEEQTKESEVTKLVLEIRMDAVESPTELNEIKKDSPEQDLTSEPLAVLELKEKTPSPPHSKEQEHGIIKKNDDDGLQTKSQENSLALRTIETTCLQEEEIREAEVSKLVLEIRKDVLESPTEVNEIQKDNPEQALTSEPQEYRNEFENVNCTSKSEKTIGNCNKVPNFMFETEKGIEDVSTVHYHEIVTKHKTETKEGHPEEGITDFKAGENQCKKTIETTEIIKNDSTGQKNMEKNEHAKNHHPISLVEEKSEEQHQEYEHKTKVDLGEKTSETCETSISINQSKELHGEIEKIITTKKLEGQDGAKRENVEDPGQVSIQDETIKDSIPTVMPILVTSKKKVECVSAAPSHVILIKSQCTKMKEECLETELTEARAEESPHKKSIEETEIIQNEVQNAELYEEIAKIHATKKTDGQDLTEVKTVEGQGQVDVQKNTLEHSFPSETERNNSKCSATEQKQENESNDTKSVSSKVEAATLTEKEPGPEISQKEGNIKLAENEKINQKIQQKRDNSVVMSDKKIQKEAYTSPNSVFMTSTNEKIIPQELEDQIAKTMQNAETGDSEAEYATAIDSEVERSVNGGNKIMDSSADETSEDSQPMDSATISLPDLLQMSKKEALPVAEHLTEEEGQVTSKEEEQVEETKTDELKDQEGDEEERDLGPGPPIMVEASGDTDLKVTKKKSHNILSGIGSKVKHSISKVKKAITGKSSHQKHHQNEVQTQVATIDKNE